MGNFRFAGLLHNFTLCAVASSIVGTTLITPMYAFEAQAKGFDINLNDIAFIARIEKLFEKAKRYKDKLDEGKLIEVLFDIKQEVEGYTGRRIDIDSQLDQIERDAKKGGAKFKSGEMKAIRNKLKKADKKSGHKAHYLFQCNMYAIDFDQSACDLDFDNYYMAARSKHDKEDDKKVEVPLRVSIGVTCSLCGYFLSFIPHPYCQASSKFLIAVGVEMCIEGTVSRMEENEKKEEENKKR